MQNSSHPAVKFKRLPHGEGLPLPAYATDRAAGMDVCAAVGFSLEPGMRGTVPIGFAVEVPIGFEMQVRPRSGLASRAGVTVLNTPGTIDGDYRGEVGVLLINHGDNVFKFAAGDRIAQLVIAPVVLAQAIEVEELTETVRGEGGFGSTGASRYIEKHTATPEAALSLLVDLGIANPDGSLHENYRLVED